MDTLPCVFVDLSSSIQSLQKIEWAFPLSLRGYHLSGSVASFQARIFDSGYGEDTGVR